jgi:hypothetical protein
VSEEDEEVAEDEKEDEDEMRTPNRQTHPTNCSNQ